jgi:cleavage and polyadenylation specificity factor subunit 4
MATASAAASQILGPSGPTPKFAFTDFLKKEYKFGLDPNRRVCDYYARGQCPMGDECPDKHIQQNSYNK